MGLKSGEKMDIHRSKGTVMVTGSKSPTPSPSAMGILPKKKKKTRKRSPSPPIMAPTMVPIHDMPMEEAEGTIIPDMKKTMTNTVARTIPHPLNGVCRKAFKKTLAKLAESREHGNMAGLFYALDDDVSEIMTKLGKLTENAYDSYDKIAQKMLEPPPVAPIIPSDPNVLTDVVQRGAKAIDDLDNWKNMFTLINASHERQVDLYADLYDSCMEVVEECGGISSQKKETLELIMKGCKPDKHRRTSLSAKGIPKILRKWAKESKDFHDVLLDYRGLKERCIKLILENKKLMAQNNPIISQPCSGPPVSSKKKKT